MKTLFLSLVLSLALVFPLWAHGPEADGHRHDAKAADTRPADAKPAEVKPAETVQLTGKILVEKDKDGKTIARVKTADADLLLADGEKLQELLKVEKATEKEFVLSGEKQPAKDATPETFVLKAFFEVEHKHDDKAKTGHDDHGHGSGDGHKH